MEPTSTDRVAFKANFYPRFRPFVKSELGSDNTAKSSVAFHKNGRKFKCRHGVPKPIEYEFSKVFNMNSSQENTFETLGVPVVQGILESYNCSIVCYGKPNTGKTYSMMGNKMEKTVSENDGLLQRCVRAIFKAITEVDSAHEYTIRFSCYEITADGDAIVDLMNPGDQTLQVAYHEEKDVVDVENLSEMYVEDPEEVFENLGDLLKNRHEGTSLFFEMTLTQREICGEKRKVSRLTFVDLNPIHDEDGDEEFVLEDMVDTLVSTDESVRSNFDFFANTVRAMLYGRALTNCSLSVLMHCSPAVEAVQATVGTLAFQEALSKLSIKAKVNTESAVEDHEQLQVALELTADQLLSPAVVDELKQLREKEIELDSQIVRVKELEKQLEEVHSNQTELKEQLEKEQGNSETYKKKFDESRASLAQLQKRIESESTTLQESVQPLKQEQEELRQLHESLKESSQSQIKEAKESLERQIQELQEKSVEMQKMADEGSNSTKQEIQRYRNELVEKNAEIEDLTDKISSTELQITTLKENMAQKDVQIESLNALLDGSKKQSSDDGNDISSSENAEDETERKKVEKANEMLKTVQRELFEKIKLVNTFKSENTALKEAQSSMKDKVASLREKLSKSEIENIGLKEEKSRLEGQLDIMEKDKQRVSSEFDKIKEDLEKQKKEAQELRDQLSQHEQRTTELEAGIETYKTAAAQAESKLQERESESEQPKSESGETQSDVPDASPGQKELLERVKQLKTENELLRTSNRNFQRIQQELSELRKYIQNRAEAKRNSGPQNAVRRASIMRPMGDKIQKRKNSHGKGATLVPRAESNEIVLKAHETVEEASHETKDEMDEAVVKDENADAGTKDEEDETMAKEEKEEVVIEKEIVTKSEEDETIAKEEKEEAVEKDEMDKDAKIDETENGKEPGLQEEPKDGPDTTAPSKAADEKATPGPEASTDQTLSGFKDVERYGDVLSSSAFTKTGSLLKEGERFKSWKRRFFRIHGAVNTPTLSYYGNMKDNKPIKSLNLVDATASIADEKNNQSTRIYCFKVVTEKRVLYLNASSTDDRDDWLRSLHAVINRAKKVYNTN